jgi:hypothetical protein
MALEVDGHNITGRFVDESEPVTLALDDVDDGPGYRGTAVVTPNTVDSARIRHSGKGVSSVT